MLRRTLEFPVESTGNLASYWVLNLGDARYTGLRPAASRFCYTSLTQRGIVGFRYFEVLRLTLALRFQRSSARAYSLRVRAAEMSITLPKGSV